MLTQIRKIDKAVDRSQQMIGGNTTLKA